MSTLFAAIELCLERKLILPALMLIYAIIDVCGSFERQEPEGTKASFGRWVESYMLKAKPMACSGIDVFGARCGILHTMAAESDLSRRKKANRILYVWGNAKVELLDKAGK